MFIKVLSIAKFFLKNILWTTGIIVGILGTIFLPAIASSSFLIYLGLASNIAMNVGSLIGIIFMIATVITVMSYFMGDIPCKKKR